MLPDAALSLLPPLLTSVTARTVAAAAVNAITIFGVLLRTIKMIQPRAPFGMSVHRSHDRPRKLPRCPRSGRCLLLARTRVKGPRGLQAGLEPGPGNISPCAAVGARCAYRGGRGKGEHGMGLGNGGPDASSWPGRLRGRAVCAPPRQVPQRGGNALVGSLVLRSSRRPVLD